MFSISELAAIKCDVSHTLKTVRLGGSQRKTRESIVEKITSHNKQSESLLCPKCGHDSPNVIVRKRYQCSNSTCENKWIA